LEKYDYEIESKIKNNKGERTFSMKSYNKKQKQLFFLLFLTMFRLTCGFHDSERLDVMLDFGYPVSSMQAARQEMSQSLYFLQHNNVAVATTALQNAQALLDTRRIVQQDDRDFIQGMIDKINALIEQIEESDRSAILDLCQQIQSKV